MSAALPGKGAQFVIRLPGGGADPSGGATAYAVVELTRLAVDAADASAETRVVLDELRQLFAHAGERTLAALPLAHGGGAHKAGHPASLAATSAES